MSNYYVSGCVADGDDVSICDDSVAQFWTLYHRNEEGLSEGIIDCMFREDAETAMRAYEERDTLAAENAARGEIIERLMGQYSAAGYHAVQNSLNPAQSLLYDAMQVLKQPATDAYLNSMRAEGVELVKSHPAITLCNLTHVCEEIANQLRGGKDGE